MALPQHEGRLYISLLAITNQLQESLVTKEIRRVRLLRMLHGDLTPLG